MIRLCGDPPDQKGITTLAWSTWSSRDAHTFFKRAEAARNSELFRDVARLVSSMVALENHPSLIGDV